MDNEETPPVENELSEEEKWQAKIIELENRVESLLIRIAEMELMITDQANNLESLKDRLRMSEETMEQIQINQNQSTESPLETPEPNLESTDSNPMELPVESPAESPAEVIAEAVVEATSPLPEKAARNIRLV